MGSCPEASVVLLIFFFSCALNQGENEDELSEDELPSDVDLNDPFFAEELAATGDLVLFRLYFCVNVFNIFRCSLSCFLSKLLLKGTNGK